MKKYKLTKEYPNCLLEVEDIVEWSQDYNPHQYICKSKGIGVDGIDVSKYPEFWKEVEKDYEILSFKVEEGHKKFSKHLANLQKDGKYLHLPLLSTTGGTDLEWMLESNKHSIHSVKRLSDGKVFTVGDNINEGIIKSFEIWKSIGNTPQFKDTLLIEISNGRNSSLHKLKNINNIKKSLFTTEDGVDIFEGDDCYIVCDWEALKQKVFVNDYGNNKTAYNKVFSTKEATEEYILMNKPCLSINDVKFLRRNELGSILVSQKDLKDLVKSRL